ncbi:MAG: hypothetical protein RIS41_2218 [Actinomycetota bacterium]
MNRNKIVDRIRTLLLERADRCAGGTLDENSPLELIVRGESVSARVYRRYNGTLVLAVDVFVDYVDEHDEVFRWIATRSGVMPFATIHVDRPRLAGSAPASVQVSHALVAEHVNGAQLDEVLDGMTYMARRARSRLQEVLDEIEAVQWEIDEAALAASEADEETGGDADDEADDEIEVDVESETGVAIDIEHDDIEHDGIDDDIDGEGDEASTASSNRAKKAARPVDDILAELDSLVGLEPVKAEIRRLVSAQRVADLRRRQGLAVDDISPHLVFVGNPGTGKTTVARLVGELYRSIGLLPSGHLVEADRSTLVAGYLGQTAIKTRGECKKALGGVLFVDEAYSLTSSPDGRDSYGIEAVNTLLTFMENHRGQMAVVVAGYPYEMYEFIESNPGLRARFDLAIEFPDFDEDELEAIFLDFASHGDYVLTPDAHTKLRQFIAAWPRHRGFGNGREVRKLFGDVTRRQSELLVAGGSTRSLTAEQLRTITAEAIPTSRPASFDVGVRYGLGGYL